MSDDVTRRALRVCGDTMNNAARAIRALEQGCGPWNETQRAELIAGWRKMRDEAQAREKELLMGAQHANA